MKNFSAHQKDEDLRISKLALLLFLVPFLGELWPLKHGELFFGTPCIHTSSFMNKKLLDAAEGGFCEDVQKLIQEGADIFAVDYRSVIKS